MSRELAAVQLDDVPRHVRRNGMTSSLAFLGSKTGKELGVCFWRVHPTLPRFTVAFKREEDRDNWCDSSQLLREMERNHGVRSTCILYDRELDQVVGGEREKFDDNNNTLGDSSHGRQPESIKTVMKDELQDLDEIFLGKVNLNTTKDSSPPVRSLSDRQSPVSSGFCSSESDGGSLKEQDQSDPPPPPPLRLPKFAQKSRGGGPSSNLLQRLVGALEIYMMGTEIGLEGRERSVAQAVADSWEGDLVELEKLYEHFLTDLTMNRHHLNQELDNIYSFPGSSSVTRVKAIQLTELFIIKAGTRVGMDLDKSFQEFISDHISKYQISKEEMLFIVARNKLDLTALFKSFQVSPNMSSFRKLLQDKVNLSGSFFQDFSQVLIDFFQSKTKGGRREAKSKPQAAAWNDLEAEFKKLDSSIERNDVRNSKSLLATIIGKVGSLQDLNLLEEENSQSEAEMVGNKREGLQEKMKEAHQAHQENKVLRSKNSSLQSELTQAVEAKEKVAAKFSVFQGILKDFLTNPGQLPHIRDLDINTQEADEVSELISGLRKIKDSVSASPRGQSQPVQEGGQLVKMVVEAGQSFSIYTNRSNNLCVRDLEKVVGMRVVSVHSEVQQGRMKMAGGYINCPASGWGDRPYWVNTGPKSGELDPAERRRGARHAMED